MNQETESASAVTLPPLEYLRQAFLYDPETGKVFWKDRPLSHFGRLGGKKRADHKIGTEVGSLVTQTTNGKPAGLKTSILYQGKTKGLWVHIIAWRLANGDVPDGYEVDHKNKNPLDNRLENLRLATHAQNLANSSRYRTKSELPRGVARNGRGFQAQIRHHGAYIYLGTFPSVEEADAAYRTKAKELHGEFFAG